MHPLENEPLLCRSSGNSFWTHEAQRLQTFSLSLVSGFLVDKESPVLLQLIKQFLFPEAVLLQGDDLETPRSASGASKPLEELVLQEAKCGTQKSRQAAFALLEELAHDYLPNFHVIKDLLLRCASWLLPCLIIRWRCGRNGQQL